MVEDLKIDNRDIDVVAKEMQSISLKELSDLFKANAVFIDKKMQMDVMRNSLRPFVIKTRHECLTLDSRKNYRLLWFNIFSQSQLEFLFEQFDSRDLDDDYVSKLYKNILRNIDDDFYEILSKKASNAYKRVGEVKDIKAVDVNIEFREIFTDSFGFFDGLLIKDFRPIIFNSSTVDEIIKIGKKYNVFIPERLAGETFRDYVRGKLEVKKILDVESDSILKTGSMKEIADLAKKHNIKTYFKLGKKEAIEYILQRAESSKDNYVLPHSDSVYEMGIPVNATEDEYSKLLIEYTRLNEELKQERVEALRLEGQARETLLKEINDKEEIIKQQQVNLKEMEDKFNAIELEGKQMSEEKAELAKKVQSFESDKSMLLQLNRAEEDSTKIENQIFEVTLNDEKNVSEEEKIVEKIVEECSIEVQKKKSKLGFNIFLSALYISIVMIVFIILKSCF